MAQASNSKNYTLWLVLLSVARGLTQIEGV